MQQYTNSTPDIHDLVQIVNNGGIIAYPTDTVYGLGCNPYMPNSVEKIFKLKIRENKPLPLLCDSLESALKIASFDKISLKLIMFWVKFFLQIEWVKNELLPKPELDSMVLLLQRCVRDSV